MLRRPPNGDPFLSEMVGLLNAELLRREPTIVGLVYDGTNLLLRFRAAIAAPLVQLHVQSNAPGGGGMTYDSAHYVSTTLVDCRADRLQDQTIAVTPGTRYAVFLVPVQYDGVSAKVMYDGEGGRPDAMASVTTWIGLPTAHNILSASHSDTTAASVVRGDLVTGQGTTPKWATLAKGAEAYYLRAGATDVAWGQIQGSEVYLPHIGATTFDSLEDFVTLSHSSGLVSGGNVTSAAATFSAAAGTGFLRSSDSATAQLLNIDFAAATGLAATAADTLNYVLVNYHATTPYVSISATAATRTTQFVLAHVLKETIAAPAGFVYHTQNVSYLAYDVPRLVDDMLRTTAPFAWGSGAAVSDGALALYITSGQFYHGLTPMTSPAFDTTTGSTFTAYYGTTGAWAATTGLTLLNNTFYNDGTTTPATLTANRYACNWIYLNPSSGTVTILYGTGDYTAAQASESLPPTIIPPSVQYMYRLIARIIYKKGVTTPYQTDSYLTRLVASTSGAPVHNELAGLQGGTVAQYYHLTSAEYGVYMVAGSLTGTTLASSIVTSSLTTIGTLVAGAVPASLVTAGTFPAGAYTLQGLLTTAASAAAAGAGLRLPHGVAPTSPVNGDIWTTSAGLYVRINGVTVGPLS